MTSKNQKSKIKNQKEATKKSTIEQVKTPSKSSREPETMEELLAMSSNVTLTLKKGDTVTGTIISISSREVLVDIGKKSYGIIAEWELERVKDYVTGLTTGDKIVAQVVNPENDFGYVVLSLRRASSEYRWKQIDEIKEKGQDVEVVGLEVAKGGLLVDLSGLRGFIPSTQLEGSFASHPASIIGKRIKVKVLEVNKELNRLVLSQKASALGVTPLVQKEKLEKIKPDDTLAGTVSGIAPFGIFVDIDGLEGLVHISEMAWEKVENPASIHKVGDKVEVLVLDVNKEEGKLNLSIKRLTPDPWKNILDRYPLDAPISGKVMRIAPYGVFVQLEPGIEGLLHISKITVGSEPKVGENLECMIEKIDPVKRKISLTLVPTEKPVGYR